MGATIPKSLNPANSGTAEVCGNRRRGLRLNSAVMQKSRDVFPIKTAQHLADITGYSLRACEYWLAGGAVIPSDALASLLHSEWGRDFLAAVMTDAAPKWWLAVRAWIKKVSFEAMQRQHQREMRELLDDSQPAPSTAQMLSDPDYYGGLAAPPRQQNRAMVRGKAR